MRAPFLALACGLSLTLGACSDSPPTSSRLSSPQLAAVVATAPVAQYPLNGNAVDASGHGFSGQLFGGVTPTSDRFGEPGSAVAFDGTTGFIVLPGVTTDNLPSGTISYWLRLASRSTPAECGRPDLPANDPMFCQYNILAKQDPTGSPLFRVQFGTTAAHGSRVDTWYFSLNSGTGPFVPGADYSLDQWHMYAVAWTPTNVAIFRDGVLLTSAPSSGLSPSGDLFLGANSSSLFPNRERLKGAMDDLRIFPTALTATDIRDLFANPQSASDCDGNGWAHFGFANHGQCVRFLHSGKDTR